ncbi:hypothetical protein ABK040_011374 [Willaertia magna]
MLAASLQQEQQKQEEIADVLMEWLENVFHTLLYIHQIYPKYLFKKFKTRYLNQIVFICQSKLVLNYISELLLSIKPFILNNTLQNIYFNILNDDKIIYSYLIEFKFKTNDDSELNFNEIFLQLRNFIIQLYTLKLTYLENLSFNIQLKTKEININQNEWLVLIEGNKNFENKTILPLSSCHSSAFNIQLLQLKDL